MTDSEINEAVASKLGYVPEDEERKTIWSSPGKNDCIALPDFCHSIEVAWEIVENQIKIGQPVIVENGLDPSSLERRWVCILGAYGPAFTANSAPMAICLAFLKLP